MDLELLIWIVIFVGGYSAVLAALLRIALRAGGKGDGKTASDSK